MNKIDNYLLGFFKPNFERMISKGRNSPNGTNLFLLYLNTTLTLLSITEKVL